MPQAFGSAPGVGIGNAGPLVLKCFASNDTSQWVSVSFIPTYVKCVQFEFGAIQKLNVAVNGSIHIFQLTDNEPVTYPVEFMDIPYNTSTPEPIPTDGYQELLSFIRYTLNYHASTAQITL